MPAPPLDPHALARAILAQRRFRMRVQVPRKTWWDEFWGWLGDRWNQLMDAFAHHVHVGSGVSVAAGDVLLVLAAAAVLVVLIRLLASYVRETASGGNVRIASPRVAAEALYARSIQSASGGEYAVAIALLFRAALVALDVRGALHDDPSLTVNECRREVSDRAPGFVPSFEALARIFTAAIYAQAKVSPAQWNAAHEAYVQLTGGVARDA